jgi:hypothetical protein
MPIYFATPCCVSSVASRVELDIVILGGELLADETFFPIERDSLMRVTISVLNFYGNWRCKMLDRVFNTA